MIITETNEIDNDLTNVDNLVNSIETSAAGICNATILVANNCP